MFRISRHRPIGLGLIATLVVASLGTAAGTSSGAAAAPARPRLALIMKSLANEFFLTMENGAKDYQREHSADFELITNGIKDEIDTVGQIRIVEQMIVSRVDAIVLAPADSKALIPVVNRAIDAGIIVVNIDNQLDAGVLRDKGLTVPFLGPDNRKGARMVGEVVARHLEPGAEVAILEGVSTTSNARQRTAGFEDAMAAAGARVVAVQSGDWEIAKGNAVAAALLSEYPHLAALLAGNDNMAIGAVSAVRTAGRKGKVLVAGYDDIDAIKPMLADGRVLATANQFAAKQAVFGIELALTALREHRKQSELRSIVEAPVELVTK
jgi:ribose transport system substrate-binding protein